MVLPDLPNEGANLPQRPTAHINEDLARALLTQAFARMGWAVNNLHSDYGEDMLIRIFKEEKATPFSFYVQSKSVNNISKRISNDGRSFTQKISIAHFSSWAIFREPVILAISDIDSKITYWECIQTNINCIEAYQKNVSENKSLTVSIPITNILDDSGLHKIEAITKSLYYMANREHSALLALTKCLHSQYGLTVQCDTQTGIMVLPSGSFMPNSADEPLIFAFGKRGKHLSELLRKDKTGIAAWVEKGIELRKAFELRLRNEKCIRLLDPNTGKVFRKITSMEEYDNAMDELVKKYMYEKGI
jgi:hypothetical protein